MSRGADPVAAGDGDEQTRSPKSRWRKIAGSVGAVAIVAVVFAVLLPRIADYSDVWDVMTSLTDGEGMVLVLVTLQ